MERGAERILKGRSVGQSARGAALRAVVAMIEGTPQPTLGEALQLLNDLHAVAVAALVVSGGER